MRHNLFCNRPILHIQEVNSGQVATTWRSRRGWKWPFENSYHPNFPPYVYSVERVPRKKQKFRFFLPLSKGKRQDRGMTTGYGLDDQEVGVRVPVGAGIFTSPCRPERLCGSANLLSNGFRGLFPWG
jgi:hypothetical protein